MSANETVLANSVHTFEPRCATARIYGGVYYITCIVVQSVCVYGTHTVKRARALFCFFGYPSTERVELVSTQRVWRLTVPFQLTPRSRLNIVNGWADLPVHTVVSLRSIAGQYRSHLMPVTFICCLRLAFEHGRARTPTKEKVGGSYGLSSRLSCVLVCARTEAKWQRREFLLSLCFVLHVNTPKYTHTRRCVSL